MLGIGDASGMFPIDSDANDYDARKLAQYARRNADRGYGWTLRDILPKVLLAGDSAGCLTEAGARLLDPTGILRPGIPVCPPEGDAGTGMNRCGMSAKLARAFRPLLRMLLPNASRDSETLSAVSANVSANLLGLGNAATPLGIQAARRMARGQEGVASDELCLLVVLNTASIQIIPATIASVRAAAGAAAPFDILPAVWLSSVLSVTAGLTVAKALAFLGRRKI